MQLVSFWRSTIGMKVVMAVTGLMLIGFVVGHVAANLLVFGGPQAINQYAVSLRDLGPLLWVARIGLLLAAILHIVVAVRLSRLRATARPVGYEKLEPQVSTFASRTIRIGGFVLAFFIIFHILHFTLGTVHPDFRDLQPYHNMVVGFQYWWVVAIYLVAMGFLGLHLYHGVWSSFRTLGVSRGTFHPLRRRAALVFAVAIWLGFTIIPVAIFAGMLR
jgi:succinate dehydrogenase / fumarate reductase, cytochrome b subunit